MARWTTNRESAVSGHMQQVGSLIVVLGIILPALLELGQRRARAASHTSGCAENSRHGSRDARMAAFIGVWEGACQVTGADRAARARAYPLADLIIEINIKFSILYYLIQALSILDAHPHVLRWPGRATWGYAIVDLHQPRWQPYKEMRMFQGVSGSYLARHDFSADRPMDYLLPLEDSGGFV